MATLKRWNGSSWGEVAYDEFFYWDGNNWVAPANGYYWDGSNWVRFWTFYSPIIYTGNAYTDDTLRKYDSGGNVLWSVSDFGTTLLHYGNGMSVTLDYNYVYFVGWESFYKYDSAGNKQWEFIDANSYFQGLSQDNSGDIFLTTQNSSDSSYTYPQVYKVDPSGNKIWNKGIQNAVDMRDGQADSNGNFYASSNTGEVIKISNSGSVLWRTDVAGGTMIRSIAVSPTGTSYSGELATIHQLDSGGSSGWSFSGNFSGYVNTISLSPNGWLVAGDGDGFFKKIDTNGNEIWSKSFSAGIYASAIDLEGNIYAGGEVRTEGGGFIKKFNSSGSLIWSKSTGTSGIVIEPEYGVFPNHWS